MIQFINRKFTIYNSFPVAMIIKFGQKNLARLGQNIFLVNLNNLTFVYLLCPMMLQNGTKLI